MPHEFKDYLVEQRFGISSELKRIEETPNYNIFGAPESAKDIASKLRAKWAIEFYRDYIRWLIRKYKQEDAPITTSFLLLQFEIISHYQAKLFTALKDFDPGQHVDAEKLLPAYGDSINPQAIATRIDKAFEKPLDVTLSRMIISNRKWAIGGLIGGPLLFAAGITLAIFFGGLGTIPIVPSCILIIAGICNSHLYSDRTKKNIINVDVKNEHSNEIFENLEAPYRPIHSSSYHSGSSVTLQLATDLWKPVRARVTETSTLVNEPNSGNLADVQFNKENLQTIIDRTSFYCRR